MKFNRLILGITAVAAAAGLCGCSVKVGANAEPELTDIVAKATVDGGDDMNVTYGDFNKEYLYYLNAQDIEDDTAEDVVDQCTAQRNSILDNLIIERIIVRKANELGIEPLTEDELKQIDAEFDSQIQQNINYFINKLESSENSDGFSELSEEEKQKRGTEEYDKFVENCGLTREDMRQWLVNSALSTKLMKKVGEEVDYSKAEQTAADYIADFEDIYNQSPMAYAQGNYSTLWIPEGSRMIQHILIGFDDDTQSEIRMLRADEKDDDADSYRAKAAEKLQDKVDEVIKKLDEGADVLDLIEEYSADAAGSLASPEGYLVIPNGETYMTEFQEAAFVPEKIGDRTTCTTDYGVHIMIYADDAKITDEQVKSFTDYVHSQNQQEYYYNKVREWQDGYKFKIDYDALRISEPDEQTSSESIQLFPYSGSDTSDIELFPYEGN